MAGYKYLSYMIREKPMIGGVEYSSAISKGMRMQVSGNDWQIINIICVSLK